MGIFCTIDGRLVPLKKINITKTLDEIGHFDIEVPAQDIDIRNIKGASVVIYRDRQEVITGFVYERIGINIKSDDTIVAKLKCFDQLGRLSCEAANTKLHIQDTLVTTVIDNILSGAQFSSWTRSNVNFTNALTETITIDLRSKDTMFSQIVEIVKSIPTLHLRYGGIDAFGSHILEIGEFNDITEQFTEGINVLELKMSPIQDTQYSQIYSVGGLSGDTRVTLANALLDSRYAADPLVGQYPIELNNATGESYIRKVGSSVDCAISKSFSFQKTNNEDEITEEKIAEAGYALWKKTIAFLQSYGEFDTYNGRVITNRIPNVGDRAFLSSTVIERGYNELTLSYDDIEVFDVFTDLRITKISTSLEEYEIIDEFGLSRLNNEIIVNFEVTNSEQSQEFDESILLSDEPISEGTNEANLSLYPVQLVEVAHFGSTVNDCTGTGISNGKIFQFNFTPPDGAVGISYTVVGTTPSNAIYSVDQSPLIDGTPLQLCVAPENGQWNTLPSMDEITIRVLYNFT